jgi:hypothetical protein
MTCLCLCHKEEDAHMTLAQLAAMPIRHRVKALSALTDNQIAALAIDRAEELPSPWLSIVMSLALRLTTDLGDDGNGEAVTDGWVRHSVDMGDQA